MKAKFSLRVSARHWPSDARNNELLALLQKYPVVEEVTFFTQGTHSPMPLGVLRQRAEMLHDVIPRYREIGVRAGINHLSTIGHLDENLEYTIQEPWQHMIDADGRESGGCFCLSDERVREYVRQSYRALAGANPDFIWIDDDVRLESHMPINAACFCSLCLAAWSETSGREWTRETLVAAFNEGTREEKFALRCAWLAHNRAYISDAIRLIRQTVNETHPNMPLGYMTTSVPYSGAGFEEWARELSGERGLEELPAMIRPGGGFYNEDNLPSLLAKIHTVGAQLAPLPAAITDVQYELENFPYHRLKKSATIFAAELAAAIGAGCTGSALNVIGTIAEPFDEFEVYFARLQKYAPFYNRAVETFGRSACEGIGITASPDTLAFMRPDGDWLNGNLWASTTIPSDWSEIGLPFSYSAKGRRVTLLENNAVLEFSADELREIFSGGVVLDGAALQHLAAMGLESLAGFTVRGTRDTDSLEVFSDDELNGRFAGWTRDCRPSFMGGTAFSFEPISDGSRVLSDLVDLEAQSFGAASGVFENELGGRVAVLGYSPWTMIHSLSKTEQLKTLMRWLSRDTLPAYIESYTRTALWCRRNVQGGIALMVLNASLDADDITVRVLNAPATLQCVRMDGREETVAGRADGEYSVFTISQLPAWQAALLV